jgi:hypothetical protein
LSSTGDQFWTQNSNVNGAVEGVSESHDNFGAALATGDFDNDGRDDLAIGVPGETMGSKYRAGAVNILHGRSDQVGLTSLVDMLWHQDSSGIQGVAEAYDAFGSSLAAGDFDNNGYDDLAIGVPGETVYPLGPDDLPTQNGAVQVIYGRSGFILSGLMSSNNQLWHQNTAGILDTSEVFENFGHDLAVGNFNNDGRADLVAGVGEIVGPGAGYTPAAHVIYGRSNATGLTGGGDQLWHQDSSDAFGQIAGSVEWSDDFYFPPIP